VDFKLAPNQSLDVEIGDTFDESGVSGTSGQRGTAVRITCSAAYAYG